MRRVAVVVAAALLLPGCSSFASTGTAGTAPEAAPPSGTPTAAPPEEETCPAERSGPDPDRPVVALDYRLGDDLRTVTGTQTVVLTADQDIDELVFRLVPNGPEPAAAGNRLVVDGVQGEDVAGGAYEAAGAAAPGGLYVVELDGELAAGESTEVRLDFTLTLGGGTFDRVGSTDRVSWWASGAPLLAREPDAGWARDPFVDVSGETASTPVAATTVSVSAPEELTVLMTGRQDPPSEPRDGRRTWTSSEPVARDVAVAAGFFGTAERTTPGGVLVRAGALPDAGIEPADLLAETLAAIAGLERYLGPFPYDTLTVALLPDYGGGIEYPSLILQATTSRRVLVHEVAHMWFYGMIGNSQFRDPWLDEAFATYAEILHSSESPDLDRLLALDGAVGSSMADFRDAGTETYVDVVYGKGGAALLAARDAAGAREFDAAMRCYLDANAWSIATPDDVASALADLPAALDVLVDAGALDEADLPD